VHFYQIAKHHAAIREWEAQKFIHKTEEEKEHAEMVSRKQSEFIIGVCFATLHYYQKQNPLQMQV
jgi:hypothetical protein